MQQPFSPAFQPERGCFFRFSFILVEPFGRCYNVVRHDTGQNGPTQRRFEMGKLGAGKRFHRVLFFSYLLLVIYLMLFAFGRTKQWDTYQFSFTLTSIPLWIPKHFTMDIIEIWVFSLGNLLMFVPFGALLPINFPTACGKYGRSLLFFVAGITLMEFLQMLTLLGSFDVEDILINAIGFSIGFLSWKISQKMKPPGRFVLFFILSVFAFTVLSLIGAEIINTIFFR